MEELEGERSRLEEDKRRLEAQLEHLTLQVSPSGSQALPCPCAHTPSSAHAPPAHRERVSQAPRGHLPTGLTGQAAAGPCVCAARGGSWCGWPSPAPGSGEVGLLFTPCSFAALVSVPCVHCPVAGDLQVTATQVWAGPRFLL